MHAHVYMPVCMCVHVCECMKVYFLIYKTYCKYGVLVQYSKQLAKRRNSVVKRQHPSTYQMSVLNSLEI